jgi:hypothetical protein
MGYGCQMMPIRILDGRYRFKLNFGGFTCAKNEINDTSWPNVEPISNPPGRYIIVRYLVGRNPSIRIKLKNFSCS